MKRCCCKKAVAFILALVSSLLLAFGVGAEAGHAPSALPRALSLETTERRGAAGDGMASPPDEAYVAEMFICAKRQVSLLGHMWVYIQNRTDHVLQVGAYTLPAGEGVSVGSFALSRSDGFGVYYNVEAYCVNRYGMRNMVCLRVKLTERQLAKVSDRILAGNYWTLIFYNCMGAAFSFWNAGPGVKLFAFLFPVIGRLEMLCLPHENSIEMYYPNENQVFKQRGNGADARLEPVKPGTLANGI